MKKSLKKEGISIKQTTILCLGPFSYKVMARDMAQAS